MGLQFFAEPAFTFQYGGLRTISVYANAIDNLKFTFQYGGLRTASKKVEIL